VRRDYISTFATEGVVIVSYLLCFRIVAIHLGSNGFGEYALARRTLALLTPLAALGLDLAVARCVAHSAGRGDDERGYVPAALILQIATMSIVCLPLIAFSDLFATIFFGGDRYRDLVAPLPLLIIGGSLQGIAYGYFRGQLQIRRANLVLLCIHGFTPLAAVLLARSVPAILTAIGIAWIVTSVAFLAATPLRPARLGDRVLELATFSVTRVPADILQLFLFALPAVLMVHVADVALAGSVAFGVAALGMVGAASSAVSMVLLPVASRMIAAESGTELRRHIGSVVRIWGSLLVAGTVTIELLANRAATIYLGPGLSSGGVELLRILMLGAVPWGIYVGLKAIVDARHVRPVNARNMLLGCLVFFVSLGPLWFALSPIAGIATAFVLALYAVGILTIREVWSIASATPTRSGADPDGRRAPSLADVTALGPRH
jgi:O-antigen/teichoic acid export membrane protein